MHNKKSIYIYTILICILGNACLKNRPPDHRNKFERELRTADSLDINGAFDQETKLFFGLVKKAESEQDYEHMAIAYTAISRLYRPLNDLKKIQLYADSARIAAQKSNSPRAKAYAALAEGCLQFHLGNTDFAAASCLQGLKALENNAEDKAITAKLYYWLYFITSKFNNVDKCSQYIDSALEATSQDTTYSRYERQSIYHVHKSNIYGWIWDSSHVDKWRDSIIHYLSIAERICRSHPEQTSHWNLAQTYVQLSQVYLECYANEPAYAHQQFLNYTRKAEQVIATTRDSAAPLAALYHIRARYALKQEQLDEAEHFGLTALLLQRTKNDSFSNNLKREYDFLSELYVHKGDYRQALAYKTNADNIYQKVTQRERQQSIVKNEILFEVQKKDARIKILDSRSKTRLYVIIFTGICALGLLVMIVLYKRISKYKLATLAEEQERMEAEHRLIRLEKSQISKELIMKDMQLQHKISIISELRQNIEENNGRNLQKILNNEQLMSLNFDQMGRDNQDIPPDFVKKLNEVSKGNLTPLYIKYCNCIYMNMDTKQIASLLNVEPHTVRVAKYRIKQRLGLNREQDLMEFLQNLV